MRKKGKLNNELNNVSVFGSINLNLSNNWAYNLKKIKGLGVYLAYKLASFFLCSNHFILNKFNISTLDQKNFNLFHKRK